MIVDPEQRAVAVRMVGDVPDLTSTPASDAPTAPDAPTPGTALDPSMTMPSGPNGDASEDDPLTILQRRTHPFS